jgi:toluene monooxygenase electron transfer component
MQSLVFQIQIAGTDTSFPCAADDTVLRAALRHGLAFPYECNVGACGNCKFEVLQGQTASNWDQAPGLSEKDKLKNRQLGCQCRPVSDLSIKMRSQDKYRPIHQPIKVAGQLISRRALTHDLSEFVVELAQPLRFASGQYALFNLPGVQGARAYSMSNAGQFTTRLEIQVRRIPGGLGSNALFTLPEGSAVEVDGPYGMAYLREDSSRDILCLAGGSGLAPMLSVARGALHSPALAQRRIHFLYGGRTSADICGLDLLEQSPGWSQQGQYQAVVSSHDGQSNLPAGYKTGFLHEVADQLLGDQLGELEIYFAGPALMAQAVLKLLVDRKVNMDQVHFDQFY